MIKGDKKEQNIGQKRVRVKMLRHGRPYILDSVVYVLMGANQMQSVRCVKDLSLNTITENPLIINNYSSTV